MQFSAILTSLALCGALMSTHFPSAYAQGRDIARLDETILDLSQAYKNRDRKRLSAALPGMRGLHPRTLGRLLGTLRPAGRGQQVRNSRLS